MIAALPLASRTAAAVALFVVHMVLAFALMTMNSTPVAIEVPGLEECPVTDLGGYDTSCIDRRDQQIRRHLQAHPGKPDFRLRDGLGMALAALIGLGLGALVGQDAIKRRYAIAAYLLPFLMGILRPMAAATWLAAFLAAAWLGGRRGRRPPRHDPPG